MKPALQLLPPRAVYNDTLSVVLRNTSPGSRAGAGKLSRVERRAFHRSPSLIGSTARQGTPAGLQSVQPPWGCEMLTTLHCSRLTGAWARGMDSACYCNLYLALLGGCAGRSSAPASRALAACCHMQLEARPSSGGPAPPRSRLSGSVPGSQVRAPGQALCRTGRATDCGSRHKAERRGGAQGRAASLEGCSFVTCSLFASCLCGSCGHACQPPDWMQVSQPGGPSCPPRRALRPVQAHPAGWRRRSPRPCRSWTP